MGVDAEGWRAVVDVIDEDGIVVRELRCDVEKLYNIRRTINHVHEFSACILACLIFGRCGIVCLLLG